MALDAPHLGLSGIVVPKTCRAVTLAPVEATLQRHNPRAFLLPLIETPVGLRHAHEIAASPSVGAVLLGLVDFMAFVGGALTWEATVSYRAIFTAAAADAGVPAFDTPSLELQNVGLVETEARRAADLGFSGKLAIHPRQLPAIHAALTPSAAEIAHDQRIAGAVDSGAAAIDGKMIDRPVIEAANRRLAIAKRYGLC